MQGLGNDFVVIDAITQPIAMSVALIQQMADRHFGIGFDQLLLIEPTHNSAADFNYRIFNADGSEVAQCGNGARCVASYLHEQGYATQTEIKLATQNGILIAKIMPDKTVTVNMGIPTFDPAQIPFITETITPRYDLTLENEKIKINAIGLGNPHAVIFVDDVDQAPVTTLGPKIEIHPAFPQRTNVEFCQIINPKQIRLRVFERGVGETLACGSGACAAVVAGIMNQSLDSEVKVDLPGGQLKVQWVGIDTPVWMRGPAEPVYNGQFFLNNGLK